MKKWRIGCCVILILGVAGVFVYKNYEKHQTPTAVRVDGSDYALTDEPADLKEIGDFVGEVQNVVDRYELPKRNFESNFLKKGTKIYLEKKQSESLAQIVFYERDGEKFVAREIIETR